MSNVSTAAGHHLENVVGDADVRVGTATTGTLQTEDVAGPQFDAQVGALCQPSTATPEAAWSGAIVGGGLAAASLGLWVRSTRRRRAGTRRSGD